MSKSWGVRDPSSTRCTKAFGLSSAALSLALLACTQSESKPKREPRTDPISHLERFGFEGDFPSFAALTAASKRVRTSYFGLYLSDKKVGFARLESRPESAGLRWTVDASLQLGAGNGSTVTLRETRVYAHESPYRLRSVDLREESADGVVERRIVNGTSAARFVMRTDGEVTAKKLIEPSAETLASVVAEYAAEPADLEVGDRTQVVDFDSESLGDEVTQVEVVARRRQLWQGVETEVALLSLTTGTSRGATEAIVATGGQTLHTSIGDGIELRLEEERVARSDVVGFDPISDGVPVEGIVPLPAQLHALTLEVEGADGIAIPSRGNQVVSRGPSEALRVQVRSGSGAEVRTDERADALRADPRLGIGDARLSRLTGEILGDERDPERRVELLVKWVFENLDKRLATNLHTAPQVLARRYGDCTEHALLFVALARAVGIPARELSGLVHLGPGAGRFGWHAWAEVEIDGAWVPVDPSLGQVPADASHLVLGIADDVDWVAGLGTLKLRVIASD